MMSGESFCESTLPHADALSMIQASYALVESAHLASKAAALSDRLARGAWQGDLAFAALGGATAGALGLGAFVVPRLFQESAREEAQCIEGN